MAEYDVERDAADIASDNRNLSDAVQVVSESTSLLSGQSQSPPPEYKSTVNVTTSETDSRTEESVTEVLSARSIFAILSLLLIGVFISNADGTLVLATYDRISSDFGAFGDASWLTTSFSLAVCAVQPLTGKLSDIYGRKGVLLTSYVLFALGSILCGLAGSMAEVIAGRVVTGIGAAGMTSMVSIIITDVVPLIQVASWRSYVNVVQTFGRSIGGPLGGLLADTIGWRWSFTGQAPFISIAIILVWFRLPSQKALIELQNRNHPSKFKRIDFVGAVLLSTTITLFLGALSFGGQTLPWGHPIVIGLAVGSLVLGILFVFYELRFAYEPIFPPTLVAQRDVATPYVVMALQTSAQLAMMFSIPLYFRATQNSSNTSAGSHLFPSVLGNTVGGLLGGFLIQRTGKYKFLTIVATISSSISYLLLILRWHGKTSWLESLDIVPGGFGTGLAYSTTFIALTSSVEKDTIAVATSGIYLSSAIGMVAGVAVSSSVQLGSLRVLLADRLSGFEGAKSIIEKVLSDVGSISGLGDSVRTIVVESYVKSIEYSHIFSLSCSLIALLIALTIREHPLR